MPVTLDVDLSDIPGASFVPMVLPTAAIHVDKESYQRALVRAKVAKMSPFDPNLAGAVQVNIRPDGSYWVMDGQHRVAAALRDGHSHIFALVYCYTKSEREALMFYNLNVNQTPPKKLQAFKALLTGQEPFAVELHRVVRSCGFEIDVDLSHSGEPGYIYALGALLKIYRPSSLANRTECAEQLRTVLSLIHEMWPETPKAASERMLMALSRFVRNYAGQYDRRRLVSCLQPLNPSTLCVQATEMGKLTGSRADTHLLLKIVEKYNHRLSYHRLTPPTSDED